MARVRSISGKDRVETMHERYQGLFLVGMRLARLEDWRHNRVSDGLLEAADYEPELQGPVSFRGEPSSFMSMSVPYQTFPDEAILERIRDAEDMARGVLSVAGMERS